MRFWCDERSRSTRWFDWAGGRFSAHSFGDDRFLLACRSRGRSHWDGWCPLPTPPPDAWFYSILHQESVMAKQKDETSACAEMASMAVQHAKAAGIDVGDATHWVCVDADGGDAAIREFPAHTAGLRQIIAWL